MGRVLGLEPGMGLGAMAVYGRPHASQKEVPRGGSNLGPCGLEADAILDVPPSQV